MQGPHRRSDGHTKNGESECLAHGRAGRVAEEQGEPLGDGSGNGHRGDESRSAQGQRRQEALESAGKPPHSKEGLTVTTVTCNTRYMARRDERLQSTRGC